MTAIPPISPSGSDDYQPPLDSVYTLLPYLSRFRIIWECACGRGNLVRALRQAGHTVIDTNPPFSRKDAFLERACRLGKPFAVLLSYAALESPVAEWRELRQRRAEEGHGQ
jgi:hypothetical protein